MFYETDFTLFRKNIEVKEVDDFIKDLTPIRRVPWLLRPGLKW